MEVSYDRTIEMLQKFLPCFNGTTGHDSYAGWLHMGSGHPPCIIHQIRLPKLDLKYKNPYGKIKKFLIELKTILKCIHAADDTRNLHTRQDAAHCFNRQLSELMNRGWWDKDDGEEVEMMMVDVDEGSGEKEDEGQKEDLNKGSGEKEDEDTKIPGYRKRWRREGIPPDNNNVEAVNRIYVAARSDGGMNRSEKGMKANSILFTVRTTCKIKGDIFFDALMKFLG